jgi:antitoxin component of RelBE/YafQ-DinJ toxin-antitoxin module
VPSTKPQTNVRLSDEAREALQALANRLGVSASAVVEMLIREKARKEGLKVKGLTK